MTPFWLVYFEFETTSFSSDMKKENEANGRRKIEPVHHPDPGLLALMCQTSVAQRLNVRGHCLRGLPEVLLTRPGPRLIRRSGTHQKDPAIGAYASLNMIET